MGKKFTCPFCFAEYDIKEVKYVCPVCNQESIPVKHEKEPIQCQTSGCSGAATVRKCKVCGNVIPKTALETPNLPFSIVGVSNSGKTNYITVMLHELRNSGLQLSLMSQTQYTTEHQHDNEHRIYDKHESLRSTNKGSNTPQIWAIKNNSKKWGSVVPTYTFTIFDGAGEDHESNLDISSPVCRYINASKAIILAVDPLILPRVKNGIVDHETWVNSRNGAGEDMNDAGDIIDNVARYIKAARGIKETKMLNIPVAVVLTKFDTILHDENFGDSSPLQNKNSAIRDGHIDMTEIMQVDEEIRNWLKRINEQGFIEKLDSHFKNYCFFGVSSFGAAPGKNGDLPDKIEPHRELDPILWLFNKFRFVD